MVIVFGHVKMFKLPDKKDFKSGGLFQHTKLDSKKPLPIELMTFIFPDYTQILFKEKPPPNKKTMKNTISYCVSIQKEAKKEERLMKSKAKKEFEVKQLEEKIKDYFDNYYKNLYKHCTCLKEN